MIIKRLGVNIDHVATLRQARGGSIPNVLEAAKIVEQAGVYQLTVHCREDQRHIQKQDVFDLKQQLTIPLNLEMAASAEMVELALAAKPQMCCIVPEGRHELTTEGGLDVDRQQPSLSKIIHTLKQANITVSLFIEADKQQIDAAKAVGADEIELHTGTYADSAPQQQPNELKKLQQAAEYALKLGLTVHAGHGLNYDNIQPIVAIPAIDTLNIGHSIICEAVFTGLSAAISRMQNLITQ